MQAACAVLVVSEDEDVVAEWKRRGKRREEKKRRSEVGRVCLFPWYSVQAGVTKALAGIYEFCCVYSLDYLSYCIT
jgi:hypothetical protein